MNTANPLATPSNVPVSSLNAIVSSIKVDSQVFRWFEFLVSRPAVQAQLSAHPEVAALYSELKKNALAQMLFLTAAVVLAAFVLFTKHYAAALVSGIFLWPYWQVRNRKVNAIAEISRVLITQDFPEERLAVTTLYQIGEIYSTQFGIPSLVDTIYHLDRIIRIVLLCVFIATWYIIPLSFKDQILLTILSFFLGLSLLKWGFIYKNLR